MKANKINFKLYKIVTIYFLNMTCKNKTSTFNKRSLTLSANKETFENKNNYRKKKTLYLMKMDLWLLDKNQKEEDEINKKIMQWMNRVNKLKPIIISI